MHAKKEVALTVSIHIRCRPELRDVLSKMAGPTEPMNELIARLLAEKVERPELGNVPRKLMGRPRKELANA